VPFNNLRAMVIVVLLAVAFHSALPYLASQPPQRIELLSLDSVADYQSATDMMKDERR
jgi:PDZ domain-containing secreted protein